MRKSETRLNNFDPTDVLHLYDKLTHQNWALRSFGALIEAADLEKHFCRDEKSAKYKNGLNQMVKLYIHRQEEELVDIRLKSVNSPERIISRAHAAAESIARGEFKSGVIILDLIREEVAALNEVVQQFGDEYMARAERVKKRLLSFEKAAVKQLRADSDRTRSFADKRCK